MKYYYQGACPQCEQNDRAPTCKNNIYMLTDTTQFAIASLCEECFQKSEESPVDMEKIRQNLLKSERNFNPEGNLIQFLEKIRFQGYIKYGSDKYQALMKKLSDAKLKGSVQVEKE